jgi:transposase
VSAQEQDEVARTLWRERAATWSPRDLVFLDESGVNITLHRSHGRAPRGERLQASVPRNWKDNTTIIGALSLDEVACWQAMSIEGACDRKAFEAFVEHVLVPSLRPGQIVVMDNLNVHKSQRAREMVEAAGCRWEYLPTYSPDLNPIEGMWSKLKAHLRATAARTQETLEAAINAGLFTVTLQDAHGWFAHAGYKPAHAGYKPLAHPL